MSNSGGPHAGRDTQELYDLRRECQRDISRPFQGDRMIEEHRDHNAQFHRNNYQLLHEVDEEIKYREAEKERRIQEREESRKAREARASASQAAQTPVPNPADRALGRYFRSTRISKPPPVTVLTTEIAWEMNSHQYRGLYSASNNTLTVWIRVADGVSDTILIDGDSYLPANNFAEIGRALNARSQSVKH